MERTSREEPRDLLRALTVPVALLVAIAVLATWYVTWSTADLSMALLAMAPSGPAEIGLAFALLVVMMVAMMLPSALPMVLVYHKLSRLEAGRPAKPADRVGTTLFTSAYFLVWGAFAVAALLGLVALNLLDPMMGTPLLVSSVVLVAAGAYQVTRTKEVCLSHCQSPMGFVMTHWRSGRIGALRMGLVHSAYCIGCCWLFMLVLFVAGAMSLLWMGAISVAIFVEKLGWRPALVSRGIGVVLVAVGVLFAIQAFTMM